ncbi:MAG: heme ABC exporter ATP-binding protein CcmA [Pseudomonadota bacterium]
MKTSLEIRQLSVERGGRIVLDGIDILIDAGHAVVALGPNGVGKTTLLRTVAGYVPHLSGTITLNSSVADTAGIGEQLHYIGHHDAIKLSMTVRENLAFWAGFLSENTHAKIAPRLETALESFQLSEFADIPAAYLSAGQKRRAALARLLVVPRPLWLLDEPTVALDTASCAALIDVANAHLRAGGIILAATHLPLQFENCSALRLYPPGEVAGEMATGEAAP